ncbi:aminomethyltransferase [Propionibacterium cyclohexanicum]|uniref:aminomethyltransferase n=1 Tax=Propionibacterium cyclohexanicum TaxID=64702 RepID=A0A1H9PHG4_9ACTN|nr:glycine cleavage system aminomethyltransferase GcvT [Propionibacterium cyclohexanicum]SER47716.1 aminomethyltransferase [Propionibacterium cyclohexanicum]
MTTPDRTTATRSPQQSPLHACHERQGARFVTFGGWQMPVEYAGGGVLSEHAAVRTAAGVFDVSHLGTVRVSGPGAMSWLNTVLANDLGRLRPGSAQYQLLCTERGGVVDDLIAYLLADDELLLVPNAANCAQVAQILRDLAPRGIEVADEHGRHAIIAVQGPSSPALLESLGLPTQMEYMSFATAALAGVPLSVCRSGYTGERGYELIVDAGRAEGIWLAVLSAGAPLGARPCGLGARDTLRTEMGYALHGHELSLEIDPVSAGLSWAIGWDKPRFRGREALVEIRSAGPARRLRALRASGRAIPRGGMHCFAADQGPGSPSLGTVTSGTYSPSLRVGIGLAYLDAHVQPGQHVGIQVRSRLEDFEVVKPPLWPSRVH